MPDELKDPAGMSPEQLEAEAKKPETDPTAEAAATAAAEEAAKTKPVDKKDEDDPAVLKQRLADTQRMAHDKAEEAAAARRERDELREKMDAQEEPKPPEMPSQEDLEEMKTSNPTQYAELMADKREFDVRKTIWDEKVKIKAEKSKELQAQTIVQKTAEEYVTFASEVLSVKTDPAKPFAEQPKEIQDFYSSPEFDKVKAFMRKHPEMVNTEGVVDKATMKMVFNTLNETYEAPGAQAARDRQKAIDDAAASGSKLTGAGLEKGGPGLKPMTKLSAFDIVNMPSVDAERYLAMAED